MGLSVEEEKNGVTYIKWDLPPVNAFNRELSKELISALEGFQRSQDQKICVITGAGNVFSAGEDLGNFDLNLSDNQLSNRALSALKDYHKIIKLITQTLKPIFACLNGLCVGAGVAIALACDRRIYVGPGELRFLPGFYNIGLMPDSGVIPLLKRFMTSNDVMKWCEGRLDLDESKARQLGMIDHAVSIDFYVLEFLQARSLQEFSFSKVAHSTALCMELDDIFKREMLGQSILVQSANFREGVSAFHEKRKPIFNTSEPYPNNQKKGGWI